MGGIIIELPLGKLTERNVDEKFLLALSGCGLCALRVGIGPHGICSTCCQSFGGTGHSYLK